MSNEQFAPTLTWLENGNYSQVKNDLARLDRVTEPEYIPIAFTYQLLTTVVRATERELSKSNTE